MLLTAKPKPASPAQRPPLDEAGFLLIEAPRHLTFWIGALFLGLMLLAGTIGYWLAGRSDARNAAIETANPKALPDRVAPTYTAKSGPWGDIQCQRTVIEVPEEYLGLRSWEAEPMQWFFRGYSTATLKEFLERLEFSASETKDLTETNRWRMAADGIFISPSVQTVLSLSSNTRTILYGELARFDENVMQHQPFHWPLADGQKLFANTRATTDSIAIFRKLCYERGKFLLFSDWKTLLSALPNNVERNAVAQALMGRYALFASVRITPQTDIEALVGYWGAGGHAKDIRPILEAATRLPGGMNVSLGSLMPPQVRARIYTFPFTAPDEQLNCHWTTFNFFSEQPAPPASVRFWRDKLKAEYDPISGVPRYGDVLMLFKPDNSIVHSCIYLADDIVYTKNGGSPFAPWQLATLPDLLDFYSWDLPANTALKLNWYRKRS